MAPHQFESELRVDVRHGVPHYWCRRHSPAERTAFILMWSYPGDREEGSKIAVDLAAMGDMNDLNDLNHVGHTVDDAVVADSDSPKGG